MEYVKIGKLVGTHGIKGEIRIISDFEFKNKVFIPGSNLYIGPDYEKVTIKSYRHHKNFDMCVFNEYDYINDVVKFKGKYVYVLRETLKLKESEYMDIDLIGLKALYLDKEIGTIKDIINNNGYKLILVNSTYIPYNNEFIEEINIKEKYIKFKNLEGII